MTPDDAFEIFDLDEDATRGDLKRAFRKAAQTSHPDKTRRKDTSAFRQAREAYDLLLPILPKKRKPVANLRTPETPPPPSVQTTGPAGPASTIYKQAAYLKGNYRGTNPGIYKQATPPARPSYPREPARSP